MDLFIVTSVLVPVLKPLSYSSCRSVFSPSQRLEQTLETIKSIKTKNKNCKILLVECSKISAEFENIIKSEVDYFYNCYEIENIRSIVESNNKSWGESKIMGFAINFSRNINCERIFKISGRYFLDGYYNHNHFLPDSVNVRVPWDNGYNRWISTCLYSFPQKHLERIVKVFENIDNSYKLGNTRDVETNFLKELLDTDLKINYLRNLGVSGMIAVNAVQCSH